jgi:hypothetical protein
MSFAYLLPIFALSFLVAPAPWRFIFGALTCIGQVVAIWRAVRIVLDVDDAGVVITNFWSAHSLSWSDIPSVIVEEQTLARAVRSRSIAFTPRSGRTPVIATATSTPRARAKALRSLRSLAGGQGVRFDVPADLSR